MIFKSLTTFSKCLLAAIVVTASGLSLFLWLAMRTPTMGGDFSLNYQDQIWSFSQNPKDLNLLYVGYVKCPDVCPMSLSVSGQAFKNLKPDEVEDVRLIFISTDFEHDTAKDVSEYASQFFPSFIGLTGTEEQIRKSISLFGASFMLEKNPKSYLGYSIAHTDRLFFLNKKGYVIDSISNPRSADEILLKIKEHL